VLPKKNGIAIFSFISDKHLFQRKKKPKESQMAEYIFKAKQLEMRPKKAKRPTKIF